MIENFYFIKDSYYNNQILILTLALGLITILVLNKMLNRFNKNNTTVNFNFNKSLIRFEVVNLNEELVKYLELLSKQLQIPLNKLKFINNGLVIKNYSTKLSQLKSLQFIVLINHSGGGVGSSSSTGNGNVDNSDNVNSESNLISVINDIINNKVKVLDKDLVNYENLSTNGQFNVNVNQDKKGNEKLNFERLRLQELYLQSMLKLDSIDLPSSFNEARNIRKSSIKLTQQNLNRLDEASRKLFN